LVPTTLDAAGAQVRQLFTNFTVVTRSAITPDPYGGSSRTTEFTAVSAIRGNVHGKLTVDLGYQTFDAYLMVANTQVLADDQCNSPADPRSHRALRSRILWALK
jgi:hypothetical protein